MRAGYGTMHSPSMHSCWPTQLLPHMPQLSSSVIVSTQTPSQSMPTQASVVLPPGSPDEVPGGSPDEDEVLGGSPELLVPSLVTTGPVESGLVVGSGPVDVVAGPVSLALSAAPSKSGLGSLHAAAASSHGPTTAIHR